jgi:hypothetical protein
MNLFTSFPYRYYLKNRVWRTDVPIEWISINKYIYALVIFACVFLVSRNEISCCGKRQGLIHSLIGLDFEYFRYTSHICDMLSIASGLMRLHVVSIHCFEFVAASEPVLQNYCSGGDCSGIRGKITWPDWGNNPLECNPLKQSMEENTFYPWVVRSPWFHIYDKVALPTIVPCVRLRVVHGERGDCASSFEKETSLCTKKQCEIPNP